MMGRSYDHIVIGVGGMGSATAMHLAARGRRVLGLEQFDIPHAMGSSHGINRIIRLAYNEHPDYVPMLRRAYDLWRALEADFSRQLLYVTGGLDAGREGGRVVTGALAACRRHDLEHTVMTPKEVARRFPGMALPDDYTAVLQPDAGFVLAEESIIAHVKAAVRLGAEIRAREPVVKWTARPGGDGVVVETSRGSYEAQSLVITAGAWAGKLLASLSPNARPQRQVLGWFQPLVPGDYALGSLPVFILDADEGNFYGMPEFAVPGFKIGKFYHRDQWCDPDTIDRSIEAADEEVLRVAVRRYFPNANGPTMSLRTCMFTNSPDQHFILDRVRETPQVAIAAGFSGHGYKFCSVVGEIMADLAIDGASRHAIEMFRMDRFERSA
ncbi:MAG: N-methyl-L-tryptophan oxidase [Hyphomicrobiaceae bacterium]